MKKIISILCIATVLAQLLTPAALADAPNTNPVSTPESVSEPLAAPQDADGLALGEETVITPEAGKTVEVPTEGSDVTVRIRGDVDTADIAGSSGVLIVPSEDGQCITVTIEGSVTGSDAGVSIGASDAMRPTAESIDVDITGDVSAVGGDSYYGKGVGLDVTVLPGENVTVNVDGDISGTNGGLNVQGWLDSDATVTVNGDISIDGIGRALNASTDGDANVTINGDIVSSSEGINAVANGEDHSLTLTVNGDVNAEEYGVGVLAEDSTADVTINGDINSAVGCHAMSGDASLTVNGDISNGLSVGTVGEGATSVTVVDGSVGVTSDRLFGAQNFGVSILGEAEASITGDVNGGIKLGTAEYGQNNDGLLVVEGTAAGREGGYAIVIAADSVGYYPGEYAAANGETADADTQSMATVEVYKLTPGSEGWFGVATDTYNSETMEMTHTETAAEGSLLDRLVNSVRYLLHRSGDCYEIENAQTDASGRAYAQEGNTLLLRPTEGYRITDVIAGEYASVHDNGDGTFTVQVARGGDLDIRANIQAIAQSAPAETAETASTETAATQLVYQTQDPDAVIHGVKAADRPALAAVLQALADDETLSAVTVHAMDSLLTAAERQTYSALGARDKLLLVLSVLTAADGTALPEGMSESARALAEALRDRLGALEANALRKLLGKAFGSGTAVLDGETVSTLRLALQTVRDGRTSYERYTFAEQGGAWTLLSVDSGYLL